MDNLFKAFSISASGMSAQKLRMDVIANNIANANTTRTEEGQPYRRKRLIFMPREPQMTLTLPPTFKTLARVGEGVRVVKIEEDPSPFRKVYAPAHPDADKDGYVHYPNVNIVLEMVDLIDASRAYEANILTLRTTYHILDQILKILGE